LSQTVCALKSDSSRARHIEAIALTESTPIQTLT
jgi:hypothetical protein